MVLGARLRTVMSSIIRWRKAEILPAGGIEYVEGLVLLIASNGTGKRRPTPSWRSSNQVSVRLAGRGKRTPGPGQRRANSTGRVSTFTHIVDLKTVRTQSRYATPEEDSDSL